CCGRSSSPTPRLVISTCSLQPPCCSFPTRRSSDLNLSWLGILAIAAGIAGYFLHWSFYIGAGVLVALILWVLWLIPSQIRLMGWQETEDDLHITKGRL